MKRIALSDAVIAWFIVFAAALWMASCCPRPPKCPVALPPPPVVIVKTPPPCSLPQLPDPLPKGYGIPDPPRGGYFVSQLNWALFAGYNTAKDAWIRAASGCLTAGRHAP